MDKDKEIHFVGQPILTHIAAPDYTKC
jgi:hypothetical protein